MPKSSTFTAPSCFNLMFAEQTLEVFGLESARWTVLATHEAAARVRAQPFEAIELDLGALWPDQVGGGPATR